MYLLGVNSSLAWYMHHSILIASMQVGHHCHLGRHLPLRRLIQPRSSDINRPRVMEIASPRIKATKTPLRNCWTWSSVSNPLWMQRLRMPGGV
jgi:hypothetical protein